VCIVAGIHGNEIAGPLSVLRILSSLIHDLPQGFRYVVYPMINPSGFDLRQRFDADGRDLNAIYEGTLKSQNYEEVQVFFEDVQKFAPFEALMALHEDSDLEKFYMYGLGEENLQFYHAICAYARTWVEPWNNAEIYGCHSDDFGLILATARDHAFDGALYKMELAKIAYTLETPGKLDIEFRVNMMTQLVLLSLEMLKSKRWMVSPTRSAVMD
jgi:predicted deacylase